MKLEHVVENPKNGTVRVVLATHLQGWFVVVKLWPGVKQPASVKFWNSGDLSKTMSYWNTKTPLMGVKASEHVARSLRVVKELTGKVSSMGLTQIDRTSWTRVVKGVAGLDSAKPDDRQISGGAGEN